MRGDRWNTLHPKYYVFHDAGSNLKLTTKESDIKLRSDWLVCFFFFYMNNSLPNCLFISFLDTFLLNLFLLVVVALVTLAGGHRVLSRLIIRANVFRPSHPFRTVWPPYSFRSSIQSLSQEKKGNSLITTVGTSGGNWTAN